MLSGSLNHIRVNPRYPRFLFLQNEPNAQNREKGISEIEGKGAMGSAEQHGSRASFN